VPAIVPPSATLTTWYPDCAALHDALSPSSVAQQTFFNFIPHLSESSRPFCHETRSQQRAPLNASHFWRRLVVSFGCSFGSRTSDRDAPPHNNAIAIESSLLISALRLKYQRSSYFQGGESADCKLAENAMTYASRQLFAPAHYLGHEISYYEFSIAFLGKAKSGALADATSKLFEFWPGPRPYRFSIGMYLDGYTGPTYSARGRINRLSSNCSITCADQPLIRETAKIGVNRSTSIPKVW
jgi:hypothetical protein